jgi:chromosome segregation protein
MEDAEKSLIKIIQDMIKLMNIQFMTQFKIINENFNLVFSELFGGGRAEIKLTDPDNILESGIDIEVQPPGKRLQNLMLLSGGEKAFTAIALLFAILRVRPTPFCILDEIDAALDDSNVDRFAQYLKEFSKNTQFILVTHRRGTMELSDILYGVTMQENGVSKLLTLKVSDIAS